MGGAYMDGDVECRRPLDELILPGDTLVAGWEAEFPNATIARAKEYTRKRQVRPPDSSGTRSITSLQAVPERSSAARHAQDCRPWWQPGTYDHQSVGMSTAQEGSDAK